MAVGWMAKKSVPVFDRRASCVGPPQVIMPTANSPASKEVVTAALLVIGGKILSGRTKDQNIGYIAEYLTAVGINLKEVRVVGDEEKRSSTHSMRSGIAAPMSSPPAGSGRPTVTSPPTAWRRRSVCQSTPIRAQHAAL
jgi:Probable molybdopterin binding domain